MLRSLIVAQLVVPEYEMPALSTPTVLKIIGVTLWLQHLLSCLRGSRSLYTDKVVKRMWPSARNQSLAPFQYRTTVLKHTP